LSWAQWFIPHSAASRSRLQGQLYRAGVYRPSGLVAYSAIKIMLLLGPAVLSLSVASAGVIQLGPALAGGCLSGMIGLLLPVVWLRWAVARRQRELRRSLPDVLDLLTACVESGLTVQAGIGQVSSELMVAHPLLAAELHVVRSELELGRPVDVALHNLAERCGLDELRSLATFIQQSQRFGATIGDALRQLADVLRTQREHRAEEAANKAAVKILVPTLLLIFPTAAYTPASGAPDIYDGESAPPAVNVATLLPSAVINLGLLGSQFQGLNDPTSPYHGMLLFQRRHDRRSIVLVQENLLGSGSAAGTV
jgi:tight adherence protein C